MAVEKMTELDARAVVAEMNKPHRQARVHCGLTIHFLKMRLCNSESFDQEMAARNRKRAKLPVMQRPLDAPVWLRKRQGIGYIGSDEVRVKLRTNIEAWEAEMEQIGARPEADQIALFNDLSERIDAKTAELGLK